MKCVSSCVRKSCSVKSNTIGIGQRSVCDSIGFKIIILGIRLNRVAE